MASKEMTVAAANTTVTEQDLKDFHFELFPEETEESWLQRCKDMERYRKVQRDLDGAEYCMHDNNDEVMGLSCPCPKCSAR